MVLVDQKKKSNYNNKKSILHFYLLVNTVCAILSINLDNGALCSVAPASPIEFRPRLAFALEGTRGEHVPLSLGNRGVNDDYIEDDVSRSPFSIPRSWSTEGGLQPTVIVNLPNLAVNSVTFCSYLD